jgi:hypothetical protein
VPDPPNPITPRVRPYTAPTHPVLPPGQLEGGSPPPPTPPPRPRVKTLKPISEAAWEPRSSDGRRKADCARISSTLSASPSQVRRQPVFSCRSRPVSYAAPPEGSISSAGRSIHPCSVGSVPTPPSLAWWQQCGSLCTAGVGSRDSSRFGDSIPHALVTRVLRQQCGL